VPGVAAASDQALDQDDADAEEYRSIKQADVIDEQRVECREDKDHSDDPLVRPGLVVRGCVGPRSRSHVVHLFRV
jgi:hypothetical protein